MRFDMASSVPVEATGNPTAARCAKCSEVLDTKAPWCKACRAKYQRDYQSTKGDLAFASGAGAMREHLARHFERLGPGGFSGYEIAGLIRRVKTPSAEG